MKFLIVEPSPPPILIASEEEKKKKRKKRDHGDPRLMKQGKLTMTGTPEVGLNGLAVGDRKMLK